MVEASIWWDPERTVFHKKAQFIVHDIQSLNEWAKARQAALKWVAENDEGGELFGMVKVLPRPKLLGLTIPEGTTFTFVGRRING